MPQRSCCVCGSKHSKVSLHKFPKNEELNKIWKERCGVRLIDDASRFLVCSRHFTKNDYVEPNAKQFGGRLMLKSGSIPSRKVIIPVTTAAPASSSTSIPVASSTSTPAASSTSTSATYFTPTPCVATFSPASSTALTTAASTEFISVASAGFLLTPVIASKSTSLAVARKLEETDPLQPDTVTSTPKRRFQEPRYVSEVQASDFESPRRARIAWNVAKHHIKKQEKKYLDLYKKNRKLVKKVASLRNLAKKLRAIQYTLTKRRRHIDECCSCRVTVVNGKETSIQKRKQNS